MVSEVEKVPISQLTEAGKGSADDIVVREFPLTIVLNNEEPVTLLCSPENLDYLAVGFLFVRGNRMNIYSNDWRLVSHG
jgi:FdhD protein